MKFERTFWSCCGGGCFFFRIVFAFFFAFFFFDFGGLRAVGKISLDISWVHNILSPLAFTLISWRYWFWSGKQWQLLKAVRVFVYNMLYIYIYFMNNFIDFLGYISLIELNLLFDNFLRSVRILKLCTWRLNIAKDFGATKRFWTFFHNFAPKMLRYIMVYEVTMVIISGDVPPIKAVYL